MDHLTVVTVAGKTIYVSLDSKGGHGIVCRKKVVTCTAVSLLATQPPQQQLFLTLPAPLAK